MLIDYPNPKLFHRSLNLFFPKKSFIFRVEGKGFLRYQIRKMMGALIRVGKGEWSLEDLKSSLVEGFDTEHPVGPVAPNGLILHKVNFQK